jgi:hypothetical protein
MQTRFRFTLWRLTSILLLLALALAPAAGAPAGAAPAAQDADPQAPAAPGDHLVTAISLGPDTPNILAYNSQVTLNFSYSTTEANGVRIYARPFTNGALTPSYVGNPSQIWPAATNGKADAFFSVTTGPAVVDQVRIQMFDSSNTTLLYEVFIPVYYLFGDPTNLVTNIKLTPDTPDVLKFDQDLNFTFDYSTRTQGGVRIFGRPFSNGALTPNYAAHGSGIYQTGSGSGSGFFTITSGQVVVDQIRIQMWDANLTTVLFEAFLPVYFRFRTPSNLVTDIEFSPDTPNVFRYVDNVNLTFNYTHSSAAGVRIFARPFSGANLSPSYAAHGSGVYPAGSGSGTGFFRLTAGPMVVDKVRIQMVDAGSNALIFETFLPVHLDWAGAGPPPGPDMQINNIEVTQAIQDLNNSVELVAGKRTYVRVHASSPVNIGDVYATLSGRRGFIFLAPILTPGNPGGDITVRTTPDRGQINDSFWFELPSGWTSAGSLTLTARLDPNNAKNDQDQSDNVRTVTVNFNETPPLRLKLVNVQYTAGGSTYLAANSHLDSLESWLRRAYPINSLQVTRTTFVYPTSGLPNVDTLHGWLALAKLLNILFGGEDSRIVYYGVVDDGGGFMRGKAAGIPGTIAAGPAGTDTWGWDFDGSYNDWYGGHEIAHTRNRYHAEFCGAGGGVAYPYTGGRISPALTGATAIYGFDITTRAIYGPSWKDVMTYCDNQWVSDFTYEGIRSYLVGVGLAGAQPAQVTASDFLAVVGMADLETFTASLENVYLISQDNTLDLPEPGDWTIALVDGSNNDLATYPFAPDALTDEESTPGTPAVIAEIVPWSAGTARVEIRYKGQTVASRSASANAPTVTLTTPADGATLPNGPFQAAWSGSDLDGDPLTYSLLYSNDNGLTWQTLASNLSGGSVQLDGSLIPGGTGQLKVVASDGFRSGQDTNLNLSVPLHAPEVQIVLPEDGQVFFPTQQVVLQGSAYDLEDGSLGDAAFAWTSSLDGFLGSGALLNTAELMAGQHVITLSATDSNGQTSQAQRTITIGDELTVEAANLEAAPQVVSVFAGYNGAAFQEPLTLRSTSETELEWSASENIPWLSLSPANGQTPSDLSLTIDPAGLSVGTYSGKITFTAASAGNTPIDVIVTLHISGEAVLLPIISR